MIDDSVIKKVIESGIKKVSLGFSTGKDSIVCLDVLLKAGIEVVPIYFYIVPDLEFINNNIKLYENHFGIKIHKMPHPILFDYINYACWQPLHRVKQMVEFPKSTFSDLTKGFLEDKCITDCEYDVNGMKMADGLNRRLFLRGIEDINHDKKIIYLAKYWTNKQMFDYMKYNNIPQTDDYKIFGRSWDGLNYHFSIGVKKYYPNDWQKIKEYFPLIDLEIERYNAFKDNKNRK